MWVESKSTMKRDKERSLNERSGEKERKREIETER